MLKKNSSFYSLIKIEKIISEKPLETNESLYCWSSFNQKKFEISESSKGRIIFIPSAKNVSYTECKLNLDNYFVMIF